MSLARGIKQIQEAQARQEQGSGVRYLKLDDGQTVKLRFLNELSEDSPFYSPERGLAALTRQHQLEGPQGFRTKAQCSMEDEGRCWACENASSGIVSKAKDRFYVNVIVDNGIDDPFVAIWNMSPWKNNAYEQFMDTFVDEGSISDYTWKLKRKGKAMNDTTYIFSPLGKDTKPFDFSGFEPYDIEKAIQFVPYDKQAEFYGAGRQTDAAVVEDDNGDVEW